MGISDWSSDVCSSDLLPRQRRQDLGLNYRETGAVYAMRVPPFLKCENRFCGKTVLVPLDTPTIEIDTMADWSLAEVYAKNLEVRSGIPSNVGNIKALVTDFDGVNTDDLVYVGDEIGRATCGKRVSENV